MLVLTYYDPRPLSGSAVEAVDLRLEYVATEDPEVNL